MNIKHIKLTFALLSLGFLPLIGMNYTQNNNKYMIYEQHCNKECTFNLENLKNQDSQDITEKNILIEQNLEDIEKIHSSKVVPNILNNHIDKSKKLMNMILCAHYTDHLSYKRLIKYASKNPDLIAKEFLEYEDIKTTAKSFDRTITLHRKYPELMKEIAPKKHLLESLKKRVYDVTMQDIKEDIFKLIKNYHPDVLEKLKYEKWNFQAIDSRLIKQHFRTTSLFNKIELIIKLHDVAASLKENIASIKKECIALGCLASGLAFLGEIASLSPFLEKRSTSEKTKINSTHYSFVYVGMFLLPPIIAFYFGHQSVYTDAKKLEKKHQSIQNLIKKFKESIKKEYKN